MQTSQTNQLAVIVNQIGLEKESESTLLETFMPFFEQANQWVEKAKELEVKDESQLEKINQASEARKSLKKIRTSVEARRKELKEDSLKKGQAIDKVAKFLKDLIEPTEAYLELQENFIKLKEEARKNKLAETRLSLLKEYDFQFDNGFNLGDMDESIFQNLLTGVKKTFEDKKIAEQEAENARLESIRLDKVENERRIEIAPYAQFLTDNSDLRLMTDEKYQELLSNLKQAKIDYDAEQEKIKVENDRLKKEAEEKELAIAEERKVAQEKADKEKADYEAKLKEERDAKEKLEKEIADKKAEEEKAEAEKQAAIEAELSKGDAAKIEDLKADLENLKTKYTFKSAKHKKTYSDVQSLLDKVVNHIISKQ